MSRNDTRIYVGNLPPDVRSKELEDIFRKYGKISFVDLKTRRGPPFAFVEFYESRDAKDAVKHRDGYDYDGYKLRVEFPKGRERGPGGVYKSERGGDRDRGGPRRNASANRRSSYRIKVTGLPPSGSWQDLKDHMREAGDVCYADVYRDGTGVVEFARKEDMNYALKKLDDSRFRSHEGEVTYVHLAEDNGTSRSHSRSLSRSRSRSPSARRSRASPTYSPNGSSRRSRASTRSRSRSPSHSDRDRASRSVERSHSSMSGDRSPRRSSRSASASRSRSSYSRSASRSPSR